LKTSARLIFKVKRDKNKNTESLIFVANINIKENIQVNSDK